MRKRPHGQAYWKKSRFFIPESMGGALDRGVDWEFDEPDAPFSVPVVIRVFDEQRGILQVKGGPWCESSAKPGKRNLRKRYRVSNDIPLAKPP